MKTSHRNSAYFEELRKEAAEWSQKNKKFIESHARYVELYGTSSQRWKKLLEENFNFDDSTD